MQIYLVRHGETDWNRENRLQGQTDIPLNNTGISQAYQLRQKINARNLKFDAVYVSPLLNSIREHIRETPPYLKIQERYQTVRGRDIFSSAPLSFLWQERQTA